MTGQEAVTLLRFAPPLDPTTVISGAAIELTTGASPCGSDQSFTILAVSEPWEEGFGNGAPGYPNWVDVAQSQNWQSAGGTFDPFAQLGALKPDQPDSTYSIPILTTVVKDWLTNPSGNFGVVIHADASGTTCLVSCESATPEKCPQLVVETQ